MKYRMRENKNQPIRFQQPKIWKESVRIWVKGNIARNLILIVAKYKNGRNMQNFQIVTDRRRIGTNFILQGFCYERSKRLLHLIPFNRMAIDFCLKLTFS